MTTTSQFLFLAAVFVAANGMAFLLFFSDKRRAKRDAWRIREGTLLCSAVLGPFGAFTAMLLFRHKMKKGIFLLVPMFIALQVFAFFWILLVYE